MNTKYKTRPELISRVRTVTENGDDKPIGDKVTGIQIQCDKQNPNGLVQIDVREFKGSDNLIVEIELPELIAALSMATLNAEREDS